MGSYALSCGRRADCRCARVVTAGIWLCCLAAAMAQLAPNIQPYPRPCTPAGVAFSEAKHPCLKGSAQEERTYLGRRVTRRGMFHAVCTQTAWIVLNSESMMYTHMATLAPMPGNSSDMLLAAWQASVNDEGETGQFLMTAQSRTGGRKWEKRRRISLQEPPYARAAVSSEGWLQERQTAGEAVQRHGGRSDWAARPLWGPALLYSPPHPSAPGGAGQLWMFYSQGQTCRKAVDTESGLHWSPGGDIMAVSSPNGHDWSNPVVLLSQPAQGGVPFVTANSPAVTAKGHWLLPFWGELPRESTCASAKVSGNSAGVLISEDRGASWAVSAPIKANGTWLIEGTIVPLDKGALLQLFRSELGRIYQSRSFDGGHTWSEPEMTNQRLPNPNSKVAALALSNGEIALVYNNHKKHSAPKRARSLLFIALSADRGATWRDVARLELAFMAGARFHYPSLLQVGCKLVISYTVGWATGYSPPAGVGPPTGIKVAMVHLKTAS
mmetsp:Transcript_40969/g.105974  ORF Transcript_40969/g.105974 Transcript_40969/m.105974 type:complete len:496 (+) Transcript_40969:513-2000(+)